jgi:hypothetical protein
VQGTIFGSISITGYEVQDSSLFYTLGSSFVYTISFLVYVVNPCADCSKKVLLVIDPIILAEFLCFKLPYLLQASTRSTLLTGVFFIYILGEDKLYKIVFA